MTRRTPAQYDWDKALFNDRRLSKNFTSPRRGKISHVTLHHMTIVAPTSQPQSTVAVEGAYDTWMGGRAASANYGVSGDLVWQYVSDYDAAWSDANSTSNNSTLSIEHANSTAGPGWQISSATMQTGARLVATLHHLYGLGRPTRSTVRIHRDYYATACPGPYMVAHLADYIAAAGRFYDKLVDGKPAATPAPAKTYVPIPVVYQNVAGYNDAKAPGVTGHKTHIPNIAEAAIESKAYLFAVTELSNLTKPKMRPLMDAELKGHLERVPNGTDGRWVYADTDEVTIVASGNLTAKASTWFGKDDKQAAWVVFEKDGARGSLMTYQLAYQDGATADGKRVAEALDFLDQFGDVLTKYEVDPDNAVIVGDTNSEGLVRTAMEAHGWVAVGTGAASNGPTFNGWGKGRQTRIDWVFRRKAGKATAYKVHASKDSDHNRITFTFHIAK